MQQPWETDNCAVIKAHFAVYSNPEAAARWCSVPEDMVAQIVKEASQLAQSGPGRSIWTHPAVPCLEARSRALAEAIAQGSLPHGRDGGSSVALGEHVAHERRSIMGRDIKSWLETAFPNEKPAFLFDDIERNSHTAINADAYRALKAENEKLASQFETIKDEYELQSKEKERLERVAQSLEYGATNKTSMNARSESSYLNIIGAMLDVILGVSPAGKPHSVFNSQAAIIQSLLAHHDGIPGIATRTLEQKFADANRSVKSASSEIG